MHMYESHLPARQGQRLLQLGIVLILYSSLDGFVIPYMGSQRIGLSAHTLSALQGVLLLVLGLVWFRLRLSVTSSRIAFWCLTYSTLAILAAYTVAAIWGVGLDTIRLMGELRMGSLGARLVRKRSSKSWRIRPLRLDWRPSPSSSGDSE